MPTCSSWILRASVVGSVRLRMATIKRCDRLWETFLSEIKVYQIASRIHWFFLPLIKTWESSGLLQFLGDCKKVHKHYIASTILANWDTWQLVGLLPNNPHFHKLQPVHFFSTWALGERSLPFIELLDNDPAQWQLRTVLVAKLAPICQISSSGSFSDQIRGLSHPP